MLLFSLCHKPGKIHCKKLKLKGRTLLLMFFYTAVTKHTCKDCPYDICVIYFLQTFMISTLLLQTCHNKILGNEFQRHINLLLYIFLPYLGKVFIKSSMFLENCSLHILCMFFSKKCRSM